MGSWFETCIVSHLPILGGEKCAAVVLIGQKFPGIGCTAADKYAALAIVRGEYDGYGRLENYVHAESSALLSALSTLGLKVSECGEMKDYALTSLGDFMEKAWEGLYSTCGALSGNNKLLPVRIVFVREGMLALAQPGSEERDVLDKTFSLENGRMRMRNLSCMMSCRQINSAASLFLEVFRESNADAAYRSTEKILGLNRLLNQLRMSWHIPSGKGSQRALTEDMVLFGGAYARELKAIEKYCSG